VLDRPVTAQAAAVWQPMATAPKTRPILLRSKWAGETVAIVGEWLEVHGTFCTLAMFGHDHHQIWASGWTDLPSLGGAA
jgi:hypothetical protein